MSSHGAARGRRRRPRHLEDRIGGLDEAEAIAADYIALAERLGCPPMPDVWW